jgi:hypothetical protein
MEEKPAQMAESLRIAYSNTKNLKENLKQLSKLTKRISVAMSRRLTG